MKSKNIQLSLLRFLLILCSIIVVHGIAFATDSAKADSSSSSKKNPLDGFEFPKMPKTPLDDVKMPEVDLSKIKKAIVPPISPEEEGKPTAVYYGELADIPIPSPMYIDKRASSVFTINGEKMGIESYTGRIEVSSLAETMKVNMLSHGWKLRGNLEEGKFVQIFYKGNFIAVISLSKHTINTTLEVVVVKTQENSFFPSPEESANRSAPKNSSPASDFIEELRN